MKLFVVGEPSIIEGKGSRNNALNEILSAYGDYVEDVTYLSSSKTNSCFVKECVSYQGISSYSKSSRFIIKDVRRIRSVFKSIVTSGCDYHIQFRIPSVFVVQVYMLVKNIIPSDNISIYVAGDWKQSFSFNYPKLSKLFSPLLNIENMLIKNNLCVFTGDVLRNKHLNVVKDSFAYYSTTHKSSDILPCDDEKINKRGVCFIGRVESLKNPYYFAKVATSSKLSKYQFHMLGDGPLLCEFKRYLDKEKITNLTLHGHLSSRGKFNEIVRECKYFILPSYTEGTSKTLPEMMCRGVIPIAFKGVGANDYIINGNNGALVDVDSIEQIESFIEKVDASAELYTSYVNSGQQYAKEMTIDNQLSMMFNFIFKQR